MSSSFAAYFHDRWNYPDLAIVLLCLLSTVTKLQMLLHFTAHAIRVALEYLALTVIPWLQLSEHMHTFEDPQIESDTAAALRILRDVVRALRCSSRMPDYALSSTLAGW